MKTISSFRMSRFILLVKHYVAYNRKLILTSIFGVTGGLFVLLLAIQIITNFDSWNWGHFFYLFIGFFTVLAIAYSGSSFPGLRSVEKSYNYLLLPATTFEKFLFELLSRILIFILLIPFLYWAIFHLEGSLVEWLNSSFTFQSFSYFEGFHLNTETKTRWMIAFTTAEGLLFLTVPFFGATAFMKKPVIKTVAWTVGILGIHLIAYAVLHNYNLGLSETMVGRFFQNPVAGLMVMTSYVLLINVALLVQAYFKLKRKEV